MIDHLLSWLSTVLNVLHVLAYLILKAILEVLNQKRKNIFLKKRCLLWTLPCKAKQLKKDKRAHEQEFVTDAKEQHVTWLQWENCVK